LLGWLFKNNVKTDNKSELLIFVTPTILKNLYAEQRDK
jgi:type II secretory pathway component HofQ